MSGLKRILVVDDSATMREHVRSLLAGEFECDTAEDGLTAYARARDTLPDGIVTDLHMPGSDGIQLLQSLRADSRTRGIPVVMVTTVTAVEKVNEARALGCVGFVLKPVAREYLLAKLRQLTQTRLPAAVSPA